MNIFSYESKVSQTLIFVADVCILNVLYILCCLPIFTIGAAQAALYSGIRTLQDPEDDGSPVKAFWKAFRTGFGSITLAWGLLFLAQLAMVGVFALVVLYGQTIAGAPVWMCIIALAFMILVQSQIPLYHARFSCTGMQLIRNSFLHIVAHPLRSLLVAVLIWLPMAIMLLDTFLFVMIGLVWIVMYYGVAFLLNFNIMKKPFKELINYYHETHDENGNPIEATGETEAIEEAEENEETEQTPV